MTYRLEIGADKYTVTLGQPEQPILIDGLSFGRQNADGSCNTERCMRLVVAYLAPEADWDTDVAYEEVES